MRVMYAMAACMMLVATLAPTGAAAPDWSTYGFPFSESDEVGDGTFVPAPPGGDIDTISMTTEDGILYLHLTVGESLAPASGSVVFDIEFDIGGTVYIARATVVFAGGDVVDVISSSASIGVPSWDAATGALVFEIPASAVGSPSAGASVSAIDLASGPSVPNGPACLDCYDVFVAAGTYTFGTGSPAGEQPGEDPGVAIHYQELTGETALAEVRHDSSTNATYVFNWTTEASSFDITYGGAYEATEVTFEVTDGNGSAVFAGAQYEASEQEEERQGAPGAWQIRISTTDMEGEFFMELAPQAPATTSTSSSTQTANGDPSDEGVPETTTTTNGTTSTAPTDEDTPGPGLLFVVGGLGTVALALRRRL